MGKTILMYEIKINLVILYNLESYDKKTFIYKFEISLKNDTSFPLQTHSVSFRVKPKEKSLSRQNSRHRQTKGAAVKRQ